MNLFDYLKTLKNMREFETGKKTPAKPFVPKAIPECNTFTFEQLVDYLTPNISEGAFNSYNLNTNQSIEKINLDLICQKNIFFFYYPSATYQDRMKSNNKHRNHIIDKVNQEKNNKRIMTYFGQDKNEISHYGSKDMVDSKIRSLSKSTTSEEVIKGVKEITQAYNTPLNVNYECALEAEKNIINLTVACKLFFHFRKIQNEVGNGEQKKTDTLFDMVEFIEIAEKVGIFTTNPQAPTPYYALAVFQENLSQLSDYEQEDIEKQRQDRILNTYLYIKNYLNTLNLELTYDNFYKGFCDYHKFITQLI